MSRRKQKEEPQTRPYETRYWLDNRRTKPITRGFPKAEVGSIEGAARTVAKGWATKVQCIDRETGNVLWTVKRVRVAHLHICSVIAVKGDA